MNERDGSRNDKGEDGNDKRGKGRNEKRRGKNEIVLFSGYNCIFRGILRIWISNFEFAWSLKTRIQYLVNGRTLR